MVTYITYLMNHMKSSILQPLREDTSQFIPDIEKAGNCGQSINSELEYEKLLGSALASSF